MGAVELQSLLKSRAEMLKASNPDLEVEEAVGEGDWGLLTLREQGSLIGFEFLETEDSWQRPDAFLQYFEASNDGYYVGVIVPEDKIDEVMDTIYGMVGEGSIAILTYEGLGIQALAMS